VSSTSCVTRTSWRCVASSCLRISWFRYTDALAAGVELGDVQGLAGHTSPLTTRAFYGPLAIERQRKVSDKLNGRLKGIFGPRKIVARKRRSRGTAFFRNGRQGFSIPVFYPANYPQRSRNPPKMPEKRRTMRTPPVRPFRASFAIFFNELWLRGLATANTN